MNRILFEADEVGPEGGVMVAGERARHILRVLGAGVGDGIRAGVIDGPAGTGVVEEVGEEAVRLRFTPEGAAPARPRLDLLLAAPRPKVMKRLWAQVAALGVDRIVITSAWKVERCYFDSHAFSPAVWRPRLVEGLQQAGTTRLPRVEVARRFKPLIEDRLDRISDAGTRLVLHPGAPDELLRVPLPAGADRVLLAVGPEGGWTGYELDLLAGHGFRPVGLGPHILRTDTACISALCILTLRLEAS